MAVRLSSARSLLPPPEKMPVLLGAGALAYLGLRRGGPVGFGLALAGGVLALGGGDALLGRPAEALARAGSAVARRTLPTGTVKIRKSITIGKPRAEVWTFVRDLERFPHWAGHVRSVTEIEDGRSHWVVKGPGGAEMEWDVRTVAESPHERISWETLPGADVRHAGVLAVRDAPGGRGTEVSLHLAYEAPAGRFGDVLASLTGEEPGRQTRIDLRRLKQLLETGEMATNAMRPQDAGRESF